MSWQDGFNFNFGQWLSDICIDAIVFVGALAILVLYFIGTDIREYVRTRNKRKKSEKEETK